MSGDYCKVACAIRLRRTAGEMRERVEQLLNRSCRHLWISTFHSACARILREQNEHLGLRTLGLRSRVGRGPCQGTFCSQLITAHLYDLGEYSGRDGITELRAFLSERWRGHCLLPWDTPLAQAELLEAMHYGLFGLELERDDPS